MEGFKEFQGKDLENAIAEACSYFDLPRERLEIEILQDAKSGIFGIVGARKAKVRARRAQLREAVESILGRRGKKNPQEPTAEDEAPASKSARREAQPREAQPDEARRNRPQKTQSEQKTAKAKTPDTHLPPSTAKEAPGSGKGVQQDGKPRTAREAKPAKEAKPAAISREHGESHNKSCLAACRQSTCPGMPQQQECEPAADLRKVHNHKNIEPPAQADKSCHQQQPSLDLDDVPEGLPRTPLEELDAQRLTSLTEDVVKELVRPITDGRVPVHVRVENGRVLANLEWCGESGLLIGREGQTLTALQYLASRMVSRAMNAAVRIQLDIGDYRLRQDEKLRSIALSLAQKARATGRPYSTRPLSSYHRRIIHLCLQDEADLQTRSSGDGPLRRVVISPRKPEDA